MSLTQSQKDLLLRLQYESLPLTQEARFAKDINVLLGRGLLSRDQHDPFARLLRVVASGRDGADRKAVKRFCT